MDFSSPQVVAGLIAGIVALVTASVTAIVTVVLAERRLRFERKLEFAAETVARQLLSVGTWRWRRFATIRHFLGGFEDDELRRVLVRAGAMRGVNEDGDEVWGLVSRNPDVRERLVLPRELACLRAVPDFFEQENLQREIRPQRPKKARLKKQAVPRIKPSESSATPP